MWPMPVTEMAICGNLTCLLTARFHGTSSNGKPLFQTPVVDQWSDASRSRLRRLSADDRGIHDQDPVTWSMSPPVNCSVYPTASTPSLQGCLRHLGQQLEFGRFCRSRLNDLQRQVLYSKSHMRMERLFVPLRITRHRLGRHIKAGQHPLIVADVQGALDYGERVLQNLTLRDDRHPVHHD